MAMDLSLLYRYQCNHLSESPVGTAGISNLVLGAQTSQDIILGHSRRERSRLGNATTGSIRTTAPAT